MTGTAGVTKSQVRPNPLAWLVNSAWSLEQYMENLLMGHWTPNHIPDLSGKVALVTGGNSGIGLEVVRKLAENCARVLVVSRDRKRGEDAADLVRTELGSACCGRIEVLQADLVSLRAVEELVREVKKRTKDTGLHILVCNAGTWPGGRQLGLLLGRGGAGMAHWDEWGTARAMNHYPLFQPGVHASSPEGLEQTLAVDYYSAVVLTLGLMDELKRGAPSRVVLQSSQAEQFGRLDFDNLKIDVFGVHPGLVDSPLMDKADTQRHRNAAFIVLQDMLLGMPTWRGSLPALYAATEPKLSGQGFRYFGPNFFNVAMLGARTPGNSLWRAGGPELRARLFDATTSLLSELGYGPKHVPKQVPAAAAAAH
ncbi:hypothetical protein GPECTOR_1g371 [Gonium pectorale]|uniref:WW domain-containing oxidoreductase n=1 Tax=Gonium pectorale TaxID=33097 RepID=A0A150H2L2_GONPE|nr:hypothetical protein GPECTOR_1g371 [Gonium pectorale]|eukprot:KXZ56417.1 hypothetical protein GPECTOR_1g371 [Gonium pectorale]